MNRKERRAAQKQAPRASGGAAELRAEALRYQQQGRLDDAAKLYRRALALTPEDAATRNDFGCLLLAQGRLHDAAAQFRHVVMLAPELFDQYGDVIAILTQVNPLLRDALARAANSPSPSNPEEWLRPDGIAALAGDPLLRCVLECSPIRDVALERLMTSLRTAFLKRAVEGVTDDALLPLDAALAKQCFINEYVFAITDVERDQVERLKSSLASALAANAPVLPHVVLAVATYGPLLSLPGADALLTRSWPSAVNDVLTQQLREPQTEQGLTPAIPQLTKIDDRVSRLVQQQYEENPYPRWILAPSQQPPVSVEQYLRAQLPHLQPAPAPAHAGETVNILVAGCGTGLHSVGVARRFKGARLTAIDLSRASLAYALRKTRELGVTNIEYAQADILELGSIGRSFDMIEAGGVLHHLADPFAGWRVLLGLLRPGGAMRVALYSEIGRRTVVAARALIAERGYQPTTADIRRCRQELVASPLRDIARTYDFFTTSECRDLLFHVQEHRLGLPAIKAFLTEHRLTFLGFEFDSQTRSRYFGRFPDDPAMLDLDHWHAFETDNPATFAGMYQFWLRKA